MADPKINAQKKAGISTSRCHENLDTPRPISKDKGKARRHMPNASSEEEKIEKRTFEKRLDIRTIIKRSSKNRSNETEFLVVVA